VDLGKLPGLIGSLVAAGLAAAGALTGSAPLALAGAAAALVTAAVIVLRPSNAAMPPAVPADPPSAPIVDGDTGLPDNHFFELLLDGRVAAARRRLWPLALVMVEIHPPDTVGLFTVLLRRTIREADTACRIGPTTFAVVLEDTGETGGVWAAERIQIAVAKEREAGTAGTELRVAAGVASYPNHALKADQLLLAAESALERARGQRPPQHGLGAVEVARADLH
jgi:predicted signal transduction protein with EAL and GGDEF domain